MLALCLVITVVLLVGTELFRRYVLKQEEIFKKENITATFVAKVVAIIILALILSYPIGNFLYWHTFLNMPMSLDVEYNNELTLSLPYKKVDDSWESYVRSYSFKTYLDLDDLAEELFDGNNERFDYVIQEDVIIFNMELYYLKIYKVGETLFKDHIYEIVYDHQTIRDENNDALLYVPFPEEAIYSADYSTYGTDTYSFQITCSWDELVAYYDDLATPVITADTISITLYAYEENGTDKYSYTLTLSINPLDGYLLVDVVNVQPVS